MTPVQSRVYTCINGANAPDLTRPSIGWRISMMAAVWQTIKGFPTNWNPDVIASAIHQMKVSFITSMLYSSSFLYIVHIHVLQFWVKNINLILNDTSNTLIEIIMNLYNFLHVSCVTLKIKGLFITLFSSLLNFISIFYNCDAIYKNNIIFIHFSDSFKMIYFVFASD